jgi:hypothetical protein
LTAMPRYYWRSVTYDVYAGTGWVTSAAPQQKYQANTPLIQGLLHGYKPLHLDVQLIQPQGRLFWSGVLFSADVPFTANWRVRPQSNLFADQSDLLQGDMFAHQRPAPIDCIHPACHSSTSFAASQPSIRYRGSHRCRSECSTAADITKERPIPRQGKAIETHCTYP